MTRPIGIKITEYYLGPSVEVYVMDESTGTSAKESVPAEKATVNHLETVKQKLVNQVKEQRNAKTHRQRKAVTIVPKLATARAN